MNRLKCVLVGAGSVLLVAGAYVSPGGRYASANEPETCTVQGCLIPPVVATGLPPVPSRPFENQTAPQAPYDGNDGGRP